MRCAIRLNSTNETSTLRAVPRPTVLFRAIPNRSFSAVLFGDGSPCRPVSDQKASRKPVSNLVGRTWFLRAGAGPGGAEPRSVGAAQ